MPDPEASVGYTDFPISGPLVGRPGRDNFSRHGGAHSQAELGEAIIEGAVLRVRPKAMTVAVILAGLAPILIGGFRAWTRRSP